MHCIRPRFFFSSRRRHTRYWRDWSSDVCSSDLAVSFTELKFGDQRREAVVVAELQFSKGDGVVFIDDGDDTTLEQRDQCVASIEVPFVMFQIVMREEDLRHMQIEIGEESFVSRHQPGLPHCGASLQLCQLRRASLVSEHAHSC